MLSLKMQNYAHQEIQLLPPASTMVARYLNMFHVKAPVRRGQISQRVETLTALPLFFALLGLSSRSMSFYFLVSAIGPVSLSTTASPSSTIGARMSGSPTVFSSIK